jgi:hypothetical protein
MQRSHHAPAVNHEAAAMPKIPQLDELRAALIEPAGFGASSSPRPIENARDARKVTALRRNDSRLSAQ